MRFYTFFLFICIQPKVKNAQKEANQYMIGPYVGQANYQQSHTACLHMSLQKSLSINAVKGYRDSHTENQPDSLLAAQQPV